MTRNPHKNSNIMKAWTIDNTQHDANEIGLVEDICDEELEAFVVNTLSAQALAA